MQQLFQYCRQTDESGVALCFFSSTGSLAVTSQEVTQNRGDLLAQGGK